MPQSLTRTQKRQKATREKIFRVAMDLFIEKGFDNTTVSEIADAADIGKGTFFTYFPTKEAIFSEVGALMMEAMTTTIKDGLAAGLSVSNILRDTIAAPAAWHEANKHITQQVIRSHFSMNKDTSNKERLLATLADVIRVGQDKDELDPDIDSRSAAIVLAGTYFAVIAFWSMEEGSSLEDKLRAAVDVTLKGLQKSA